MSMQKNLSLFRKNYTISLRKIKKYDIVFSGKGEGKFGNVCEAEKGDKKEDVV
ncbi:MAG: hypothetical protein V2G48_06965 [bacterium JZ-2024 1]